jgi:hypothetical protein
MFRAVPEVAGTNPWASQRVVVASSALLEGPPSRFE